jgi:hypothetical protein
MRSAIDEKIEQLELDESRLMDALKRLRTEKALLLDRKLAQSEENSQQHELELERERARAAAEAQAANKPGFNNRVKNTINNNEGVHRPLQLVCHICGEEFGTNSLKIHQKSW